MYGIIVPLGTDSTMRVPYRVEAFAYNSDVGCASTVVASSWDMCTDILVAAQGSVCLSTPVTPQLRIHRWTGRSKVSVVAEWHRLTTMCRAEVIREAKLVVLHYGDLMPLCNNGILTALSDPCRLWNCTKYWCSPAAEYMCENLAMSRYPYI